MQPTLEIVTFHSKVPENESKRSGSRRHNRSKTDCFMTITINDNNKNIRSNLKKLGEIERSDSNDEPFTSPPLENADSDLSNLNLIHTSGRRHSNFTNSSLSFIPTNIQTIIKPTGSLELGYIDSNEASEGFYFKQNNSNSCKNGVRRIRSTCWPHASLSTHPSSLELINSNRNVKNPLQLPNSPLIRHQHLNLCPFFGSEIVYPIAEQSDEHQTSHGPDTDLESFDRNSDSDYEENNQGSRSPLLVHLQQGDCIKVVQQSGQQHHRHQQQPHCSKELQEMYNSKYLNNANYNFCKSEEVDRSSATSKDALLDNENSNSSATPEMQDARTDCFATDNESSDKKLSSECSNLSYSNSSIDLCENTEQISGQIRRSSTVKLRQNVADDNCMDIKYLPEDNYADTKNDILVTDSATNTTSKLKRKMAKRNKRRRKKEADVGNCSSLIELDLDWLFDDENEHLKYSKGKVLIYFPI